MTFITAGKNQYLSFPETIKISHLNYEKSSYRRELFDELGVTFPESLNKAVDKRCAEYLAGRYAASNALLELTEQRYCIYPNQDRSPNWPIGITGSISHNSSQAIAAVASSEVHPILGIDIEEWIDAEVADEIGKEILIFEEYQRLGECRLSYQQEVTLIFSAKESLYKALYPTVKRFFSFEYASVNNIDCELGCCTISLEKKLSEQWQKGASFKVRFSTSIEGVVTFLWESLQ